MGIALFLLIAVILFMAWSYSYSQTPIQEKPEPKPEPKFEDQFEYYDAYLPEVITEDLEERALRTMLQDCRVAVEYYKIEDPKKVKYYEHCVQLCKEKLIRIVNEHRGDAEQDSQLKQIENDHSLDYISQYKGEISGCYIINEENLFSGDRMLQLYTHPDTDVSEYVTSDELFRRSVDGNMHKKNSLYMTIKFLEGKLREVNEDIWFPDSLGNQFKRALYTRNLEGLKKYRKHLYNCEGACYIGTRELLGEYLEFPM